MQTTAIEEKYPLTTAEESVINKDWAAGSSKQLRTSEYVIRIGADGRAVAAIESVKYPPAWWKIIDEPIVNALDHVVRCVADRHKVTKISVDFDQECRVRIYNDGPGIEADLHPAASERFKRPMHVPTFLFGVLFQGSNQNRPDDCIFGGTNGLGAKLSNCFSTRFAIETVRDNIYFLQSWSAHMSVENPPIIVDLSAPHTLDRARTVPHTLLSFSPDYCGIFGYSAEEMPGLHAQLVDIVRTRVYFAAAYARSVDPAVQVLFNGTAVPIRGMADLAALLCPGQIHSTVIRAAAGFTWQISAGLSGQTRNASIVNGCVVTGGPHIKHVADQITTAVMSRVAKTLHDKDLKFSPSIVLSGLNIFISAQIPCAKWTGQRKDVLVYNARKFAPYKLGPEFLAGLAERIQQSIMETVLAKTKPKSSPAAVHDKYIPARKCRKQGRRCSLLLVEGDSAMTQLCVGVTSGIGFDYYGVMSLRGVIMNVRKNCTVVDTLQGRRIHQSAKLANNKVIQSLLDITGLRLDAMYLPDSPTYNREMAALRYGAIIACVDQDLDGKGNILGLILNMFDLFWPNLLAAGYVKWFITPIIRAYPRGGGTVCCFYNTADYDAWERDNPVKQYKIEYYKGIGTHSRDETIHMFKDFAARICTFAVDAETHKLFNIYYGTEPNLRKIELALPMRQLSAERIVEIARTCIFTCSEHLRYETWTFQKDNLERKLDSVIDGQNQSGRKILDGLLKIFAGREKQMNVAQLAGEIARSENYHRGESSLMSSITGRGLITTGGKQLPLILPKSNFGSRKGGGADASQPRYIRGVLNSRLTDLLFPAADYQLLPFNFDEGKRSEPQYFVPIIPLAICESAELPSHGWKLKIWARSVHKVIENVRRLIRLGDDVPLIPMPPCSYSGTPYAWGGEFKTIRGELYSFGRYSVVTENKIVVTELPLRVWTTPWVEKIRSKMQKDDTIIKDIYDESNDLRVNVTIMLRPGALDLLNEQGDMCWTDGIEEYFALRKRMDSHINFMGPNYEVLSYSDYAAPMYAWFKIRKELYAARVARQIALIELRIRYTDNIIRYIDVGRNMRGMKNAEMVDWLAMAGYDKYCKSRLTNPDFCPTEQLADEILRGPKSTYKYLLDLSDRAKSVEALDARRAKRDKYHAELGQLTGRAAMGRFTGAAIWEDELTKLAAVCVEGGRTFWKFTDSDKYNFA